MDSMVQSHSGVVLEKLQPMGMPTQDQFRKDGPVRGTHVEQRQSNHDLAAETKCYGVTSASISLSPSLLMHRR